MRPLAVFDIDGVLADVRHRVHFLERLRPDWRSFFAEAVNDPPHPEGIALVREVEQECEVVYLTGRPEWCRADTEEWLAAHDLPAGQLAMRRNGDHRPARKAKPQLLETLAAGRTVAVVVDDDLEVCDAYERLGLTVLRATWAPRSDALVRAQEDEGLT